MTSLHCFTSASFTYLDRARVLAESVRLHHPDWQFHLLLCDDDPEGLNWSPESDVFDSVLRTSALDIPEYRRWAFGHNIVEFCTAVKGFMLERLLASGQHVIYLDPDIQIYSPLVEVEKLLEQHSVVLTPHLTSPETTIHGITDNEIGSLRHGTYNLGFVAVRASDEGMAFARWWRERLHRFCWDDISNGLFVDQRWCDLAPSLFDKVAVLRHPGYNVASWNLGARPIDIGVDGEITAANLPLRFFHFTKVNSVGENMLRRYAHGRLEVFELLRHYRARLEAHRFADLPEGWWVFNHYSDGDPIPQSHRVLWRMRKDLRDAFANPFEAGPGSFKSWCAFNDIG